MSPAENPRFLVDLNTEKLAKWLRLIGYDALLFDRRDDKYLIHQALAENRIILTRDTQLMLRRVITTGELKAVLITEDNPLAQIRQVIRELGLNPPYNVFQLCLECNTPLQNIAKEAVRERVPPYVFQTQNEYRECPNCHRIYWQGTHWQAMQKKLAGLENS